MDNYLLKSQLLGFRVFLIGEELLVWMVHFLQGRSQFPLLDFLGDPLRAANSTYHEWMEDSLLPNKDVIDDSVFADAATDTDFDVANGDRFQIGDQVQVEGSEELMLVDGRRAYDTIDMLTTSHNNRWCGSASVHEGGSAFARQGHYWL